ncbi:helix-turn-helix domain-containing protein [Nonomuraea wenchangensis]
MPGGQFADHLAGGGVQGGEQVHGAVPDVKYELELRAERQAEGIAAAKRREATGAMLPGKKKTGRPRAVGPAELATLRRLVADGVTVTEAARTLKIGRSTVYEALSNADLLHIGQLQAAHDTDRYLGLSSFLAGQQLEGH